MNKRYGRKFTVIFLALICCLLWGSAFPCVKIGYRYFSVGAEDSSTQILFAGCRFILAGILVILFASIKEKKVLVLGKTAWFKAGKLSLFQTVFQYLFFYLGLAHTTGVKSSILEAAGTFFTVILASKVFRKEPFTKEKFTGCILGFAGVLVINLTGKGLDGGFSLTGEGFILLSCMAYAVSSVLIKKYAETESTVLLSGYQFFIGGLILVGAGILFGGSMNVITGKGILLIGYLALVSAVAYTIWGILLSHNPVAKVAVFGFMTPICGVVLSGLLLPEGSLVLGGRTILALVLVSLGIYEVNREDREKSEL